MFFDDISFSVYIAGLLLLSANTLMGVAGLYKINRIVGVLSFLTALAGVILVYTQTGHLPMSGTFEKMQNIVLIIVGLGLVYEFKNIKTQKKSFEFWIIALIFQSIALWDVLEADPMFYLYENIWVSLFFQFRLISMAVLAFALSKYISALRIGASEDKLSVMNLAGNFTLLGAVLFLSGEFSGSVWAQLGYGDAWHWSSNFFTSGSMFLLALVVSHLNPAWLKTRNRQIILSIIPMLIILILFLI